MERQFTVNNLDQCEQNIKLRAFDVLLQLSAQLPSFPDVNSIYASLTNYLHAYFQIEEIALFEKTKNTFTDIHNSVKKTHNLFLLDQVFETAKTGKFLIQKADTTTVNEERCLLYVPITKDKEVTFVIALLSDKGHIYNNHFADAINLIGSTAHVYAYKKAKTIRLEKERDVLSVDLSKQYKQLDLAIEALSEQSSEIKRQEHKKNELTQEIHHRVNNNLQIISSLINLYASDNLKSSKKALIEVQKRVQTMAVIHQNIHKTLQPEFLEVGNYIST